METFFVDVSDKITGVQEKAKILSLARLAAVQILRSFRLIFAIGALVSLRIYIERIMLPAGRRLLDKNPFPYGLPRHKTSSAALGNTLLN